MFPILGLIGTLLVAFAYIPQIRHLLMKKCAACISIRSWFVWIIAALLIFLHAITGLDLVFKVFSVVNLIFITITFVLALVYKEQTCNVNKVSIT